MPSFMEGIVFWEGVVDYGLECGLYGALTEDLFRAFFIFDTQLVETHHHRVNGGF